MNLNDINKHLNIPEEDKYTPIKANEAAYIYNFLTEKALKKTLEIGFAYARSASHIIAATLSNHIVIDPFQSNYNNLGLSNIEKLDFDKYLTFYNDFSHNVLPKLLKDERKFDFIFIDGDHKFDGIFVDFYYADLLVNEGGYLLFHDTWMRSTQLAMSFIKTSKTNYVSIKTPLRNFALFQKKGVDQRDGMHFKEFYTLKSLLTHHTLIWLSNNNNSFFKKKLLQLKDLIK